MSEIKLLPCPFCGGEAYFPTITKTFIVCKSCGFETEYTEDTEWLVNTWNTRKPIEKAVKELEELQQYYIYSIDDLVRLSDVKKLLKGSGLND